MTGKPDTTREHERIAERTHDEMVQANHEVIGSIDNLRPNFIKLREQLYDWRNSKNEDIVDAAWRDGYNILGAATDTAIAFLGHGSDSEDLSNCINSFRKR